MPRFRRLSRIGRALLATATAVATPACNALFGIDGLGPTSPPGGGGTGALSSGPASTGAGGAGAGGAGGGGGGGADAVPRGFTTLWSKRFGDGANSRVLAMATGGDDNIWIAGEFRGQLDLGGGALIATLYDGFVAKLSPDGGHLFSERLGGSTDSDSLAALAMSADGPIVAGRYSSGSLQAAYGGKTLPFSVGVSGVVLKLDGTGSTKWFVTLPGDDVLVKAVVALDYDAVVTGTFSGGLFGAVAQGRDAFLARVGKNGLVWLKHFVGDGEDQFGEALAVSGLGNIVLAATLRGSAEFGDGTVLTSAGGEDIVLVVYSPDGKVLLAPKRFGGDDHQRVRGMQCPYQTCYLTGEMRSDLDLGHGTMTSAGVEDVFVAELGSGGALWSHRFGDTDSQKGIALAERAGRLVLTGKLEGGINFGGGPLQGMGVDDDIVVAELSAGGGAHVASQAWGSPEDDGANAVAIDSAGDILIAGEFSSTLDFGLGPLVSAGGSDCFVAKLRLAEPRGLP
jgi:hypothetical protein